MSAFGSLIHRSTQHIPHHFPISSSDLSMMDANLLPTDPQVKISYLHYGRYKKSYGSRDNLYGEDQYKWSREDECCKMFTVTH
ncbi:uncharacterized protein [Lolium perenne]|uniref:uncharacterized protein n=1 Tax=Lolium perenne TaxID=4522 RepID=UPI003A9A11FE